MTKDEHERDLVEVLLAYERSRSMRPQPSGDFEKPTLVHGVPRRRIRIDGERRPATAVQEFDGKALHYVLDPGAAEASEISIFTDIHDAERHTGVSLTVSAAAGEDDDLDDVVPNDDLESSSQALTAAVTFGGYVDLFEHPNYGGSCWTFYPSWGSIPDFRRVYPTLWWSTNINDQVSSIDVNVHADPPGTVAWVVLFRHIDFGGDSLWTSSSYAYPPETGGGMRSSLVNIGWDDGASSLAYGYSISFQ